MLNAGVYILFEVIRTRNIPKRPRAELSVATVCAISGLMCHEIVPVERRRSVRRDGNVDGRRRNLLGRVSA
jgi:hypothetical protein